MEDFQFYNEDSLMMSGMVDHILTSFKKPNWLNKIDTHKNLLEANNFYRNNLLQLQTNPLSLHT